MSASVLLFILLAAIALVVLLTAKGVWHPVWALLAGCLLVGLATGLGGTTTIQLIGQGFGNMLQQIGLIVVFGAVLGVVLEASGGATTLAESLLRLTGARAPALSLAAIGALVSIPVFCDSGFIILSRLNAAIHRRTGTSPATLALALAGGLYTTHTLVPPTPGPVAAAGNLGAADYLGWIMLLGLLTSIPVILVVWWWARKIGPSVQLISPTEEPILDEQLPAAWRALLPMLLPIILIGLGAFTPADQPLKWLTLPPVALVIGVLMAFLLLAPQQKNQWTPWTAKAISLSGPILIITGMGGAFGEILKATPLAEWCESWLGNTPGQTWVLLLIAFGLTALLKTAQGSSTSALVIASSIIAPLAPTLGFDTPIALALLVLALGAGAMMVSHANDSYFWVVSQFSGIAPAEAFRTYSVMTALMGLTTLAMVMGMLFLLV